MSTPADYRNQATDALFNALTAKPIGAASNLLYDPNSLHRPQDAASPATPPKLNLAAPPKLLAAGTDDTLDGHHSHEILTALAGHSNKMLAIDAETAKLNATAATFGGQSTSDIAAALVQYAKEHGGAIPPTLTAAGATGLAATSAKAKLMAADSAGVTATLTSNAYSLAATLQSLYWARVIYCITWIVAGLVLLFFGYSSLFWASRIGAKAASSPSLASEVLSGRKPKGNKARPAILGGGVGGILIGFLFFSYLAAVIHSAVCADQGKTPLSGASFFAVWIIPGVVGAALGGHFAWAARIMSGLAGGPCLTIILTAVFGIHTILARSILFAIFTVLLTAPVVLPQRQGLGGIQTIVLMLNTSLLGVVTFLDGVALFAPPPASSASWIDLWVLLFAKNDGASQQADVYYWGSSAFKGYIAGAVLGTVIGFAFEFLLHRHAGQDPELEFNSYLGAYAERVKQHQAHGGMPGAFDGERAGLFSPTPGAWQKVRDMFEAARAQSATYGNLPGGQRSREASPLTDLPPGVGRARSHRSGRTARGVPARFEALSARDKDVEGQDSDSESDATDVDSDAELDEKKGYRHAKGSGHTEAQDKLSPLARGTYAMPPKPPMLTPVPSYRTEASGGGSALTSSTLSGTTMRASEGASSPTDEVHKPLGVYRDGDAPRAASPPATATATAAGAPVVAATPSLINAISRIQQAQAQARAWQAMQAAQGAEASLYGTAPELPSAPGSPAPPPARQSGDFDGWWKKQVTGGKGA